ncbi:MAG: AsmA family protein, partial [Chlorobi bacterium]|nr:AsmA family protein [Chlorobiota bacterium]
MSEINIEEEENQPEAEVAQTPPKAKAGFFKRAFRFVFKSAIFLLLFLLLTSVAIVILSYSEGFRSWSSEIILDKVNSSIEGEIEFSDIRINPFEGVELDNIRIMAAGDTVLYCKQVTVSLQIKPIFDESLMISKIMLDSPRIKLLRSAVDSSWNIAHIAAASKKDPDADKSKSKWKINVAGIEMIDGSFIRYDSTLSEKTSGRLDFNHLDAVDINFDISANVDFDKSIYKAEVNSLSLYEQSKDFKVLNLKFIAELRKDVTIIKDMQVLTPKSCVNIDLQLDSTDIIGGFTTDELFNAPLTLQLRIDSGSVSDALKFAKIPLNPIATADITLDLTGSINNPRLRNFKIKTGKTELDIDIDVQNTTNPKKIQFQLSFNETILSVPDARRILRGIDLSSVPDPGILLMDGTTIDGNLDTISTNLKVITQAGSLDIAAGINLKKPLRYSGNIQCDKLDLGRLLDDVSLKSNVSSVIEFTGSGTNEDNLFADFRLSAGRSQFGEYDFKRLRFKAAVTPGLKVTLDSMLIVFADEVAAEEDDYYDDLPESYVFMNVDLDLSQDVSPIYHIRAKTHALNIANLLKKDNLPEYFTSKVEINASGVHPDSIVGTVDIGIEECYFTYLGLLPFDMSLTTDRNESERSIILKSDFVNAEIRGNYTVEALTQAMEMNTGAISDFVESITKTTALGKDSTVIFDKIVKIDEPLQFPEINLKLIADIKDISPVASLLQLETADFSANVDMDIFTGGSISRFGVNQIKTGDIRIKTNTIDLRCDPLELTGKLLVESKDSLIKFSNANFYFAGNGNIKINDLTIGKPKVKLSVDQKLFDFEIQSSVNEKTIFSTAGDIEISADHLNISLNQTNVSYEEYSWESGKLLSAVVGPGYIDILKLNINRKDRESISLSGVLRDNKLEDVSLDITNIKLTDINKFIEKSGDDLPLIKSGVVNNINIHTEGTLENPHINLRLNASDLAYNGTTVGDLSLEMFHRDSTVIGKMIVIDTKKKDSLKTLEVDIERLPINLAFTDIKNRLRDDKAKFSLKARDLPLNIAGSFVPGISKLRGRADATLNLNGYLPDDFDFDGSVSIKNAKFLSDANNMYYSTNAKIFLNSDKITVEHLSIYNSKLDLRRGKANISGFVTLDDKMKPDEISFSLSSKGIKVLSKASEKSMPAVFGDFVIATGDNPMKIYGKTDALNIRGDLNVVNANVYMPDIDKTSISKSVFKYEI